MNIYLSSLMSVLNVMVVVGSSDLDGWSCFSPYAIGWIDLPLHVSVFRVWLSAFPFNVKSLKPVELHEHGVWNLCYHC